MSTRTLKHSETYSQRAHTRQQLDVHAHNCMLRAIFLVGTVEAKIDRSVDITCIGFCAPRPFTLLSHLSLDVGDQRYAQDYREKTDNEFHCHPNGGKVRDAFVKSQATLCTNACVCVLSMRVIVGVHELNCTLCIFVCRNGLTFEICT